MKKAYVKPVMESEEFVTNAYCGSCTSNPVLKEELIVNNTLFTWPVATNNGSTIINYNSNTYSTDHVFNEKNYVFYNDGAGNSGKVWKCTCHGGDYFLEYSDRHSASSQYGGGNGKQVFYLYYDINQNGTFDVADYPRSNPGGPWGGTGGDDLALSRVTYLQEMVANS